MAPPVPTSTGSSPHTRGTLEGGLEWYLRRRLIPAHAGNTTPRRRSFGSTPAHPRTRGEHGAGDVGEPSHDGSSPHTRGTPRQDPECAALPRLIPAHAGNTSPQRPAPQRGAAHPRTRGEHPTIGQGGDSAPGSSPHTRGTRGSDDVLSRRGRLIPAHAGNTDGHARGQAHAPAHPRTRGEHVHVRAHGSPPSGSSPHTRGTRVAGAEGASRDRLIPAHAGNTRPPGSRRARTPAHPRTRGEHLDRVHRGFPEVGSSPHTRGTRPDRGDARARGRLIPAHAGNTRLWHLAALRGPAHPRTRGEHLGGGLLGLLPLGSSPHTRGTPRRRHRQG